MKNYFKTLVKTVFGCCGSCLLALNCNANSKELFELKVSKPTFVIPQFTGAYQEREASIAPEEYERAEILKGLLENDDRQAVLEELEKFYDIELSPAMQTLKAQVYFSLQKYKEAEETYKSVLQRMPQLIRAHSDLAQLYLLTDRPEEAQKHFARAVEYGASEAYIHGQLGYLNLTQYGPFSAISHYQKAMSLEPDNSQWYQGLLAALTKAQMYDAASALIGEILARNPGESELWLNKATLYLKQDKLADALSSIEMALLLGDNSETNLRIAAQLHLERKSYGRAMALIDEHLSKVNFKMATLSAYMSQLESVGLWSEVDKLLKSIQTSAPNYSDRERSLFYLHQATVKQNLNQNARAESLYQKSLEDNPLNGLALLRYAKFCLYEKKYPEAELLYIRAESIDEVEKDAMLGRSQLYIQMQDFESALKHLREVKAKYPFVSDLSEKIEIIENIVRSKKLI